MSLEGGCLCGAVRYAIDEEAPPMIACFCSDCRKRSGGGVGMTMPVWASRFSVEGECVEGDRVLDTGAAAKVFSCARCLTELHSHNSRMPDLVTVRAGTLDRPQDAAPAAYMWMRSKQPWLDVPERARLFETQPDDPAVWMDIFELGRRPQ